MIKLAMELPTSKLRDWSGYADLDFILAHKVLQDAEYAEFFQKRPAGREVILDNSYHELGFPLPASDLLEAANRCRADYVISPDRVGDVHFNTEQFLLSKRMLAGYKIAVVMTTPAESEDPNIQRTVQENFLFDVREASMLCLTFKDPRRFDHYMMSTMALRWKRLHLLGVSELSELPYWLSQSNVTMREWSIDTGKPLKWAMRGHDLRSLTSLRMSPVTTTSGGPSEASQRLLDLRAEDISPEQEALFITNVGILREYL